MAADFGSEENIYDPQSATCKASLIAQKPNREILSDTFVY